MHFIAFIHAVVLTIANGIIVHAFTIMTSEFEVGAVPVRALHLIRSIATIVLKIAFPPSRNTSKRTRGLLSKIFSE